MYTNSIYQRWHQLYTSYYDGPERRGVADSEGFANLNAFLPISYVMENLEQLQVATLL